MAANDGDDVAAVAAPELSILRRNRKSAVSRHLGTLARRVAEEDVDGTHERLDTLKSAFRLLEEAHDNYHETLTTDADIMASETWFSDIECKYIDGIKSAKLWLKSYSNSVSPAGVRDNASDVSDSASTVSQAELFSLLSLPKAEIDVFTGNPLDYQSFMAIFDETIHNRCDDGQVRLTRLLQYTSGAAKLAIKNCTLIGGKAGYEQAREILKNRFGNDHLVSRQIIAELRSGKSVQSGQELQQLADELSMASTALKGINMLSEVDTQQSILDITQRCPNWVRAKWRNRALDCKRDNDRYPTFDEFVKYIQRLASDSCDPLYGNVTNNNSVKSQTRLGRCR